MKGLLNLTSDTLDIIRTNDGSFTLLNKSMDETYHSVNGAMTESLHVFINNGLLRYKSTEDEIHILEVGLGTGLNALLTLENIPEGKTVYYTAIEPYPIDIQLAIDYFRLFENKPKRLDVLEKMMEVKQTSFVKISDHFYFKSTALPLLSFSLEETIISYNKLNKEFGGFDIVYYDAFGPQKQPDMWEIKPLEKVTRLLKINGLLTSYCAQGQFKRHLKSLNLLVERVSGPPGKREMTIAIKQ